MENQFEREYSDDGFWDKAKRHARTAGKAVLEPALKLYYSALDSDTPAWAKATIYAALGYFISPIDAIPDMTPIVGYADDLGVLVSALAAVAAHVKDKHTQQAREALRNWLGDEND